MEVEENEVIYLPGSSQVFEPEVSSINYEPPTQPTAFNFSQFENIRDQLAQKVHTDSHLNPEGCLNNHLQKFSLI